MKKLTIAGEDDPAVILTYFDVIDEREEHLLLDRETGRLSYAGPASLLGLEEDPEKLIAVAPDFPENALAVTHYFVSGRGQRGIGSAAWLRSFVEDLEISAERKPLFDLALDGAGMYGRVKSLLTGKELGRLHALQEQERVERALDGLRSLGKDFDLDTGEVEEMLRTWVTGLNPTEGI